MESVVPHQPSPYLCILVIGEVVSVDVAAKSGRARVVFLLTVFAKNEKTSLSVEERRALIRAAKSVIADYRGAS